ncbi:MAG: hypothetical protein ACRDRZ_13425, partial [Pseudonocardiaceae bacterium]
AEKAAADTRAAEQAADRRQAAEQQAAEAEEARVAALAREEAARQAAEEAESARKAAVRALAEQRARAAQQAAQPAAQQAAQQAAQHEQVEVEIDLRAPAASRVSAAGAPSSRVTAPVSRGGAPTRRLQVLVGGGPDGTDDDDDERLLEPGEVPLRTAARRITDEEWAAATSGPSMTIRPRLPEPRAEHVTTGGPHQTVPLPAWLVRLAAAAMLPVALSVKTGLEPGWWGQLAIRSFVGLVLVGILTVLGIGWLWRSTQPPYALRRRDARRILRAMRRREGQEQAAATLLAALRNGSATLDTWHEFEIRTGLTVPASTRTVVDPEMQPAGLVRYLVARQQISVPKPLPLLSVALVPFALCLLPALVLLGAV